MLRLLTDPRVSLDPTRAAQMPAPLVYALGDALDLRDEADRLASGGDD
jgi:hypothetical protein